MKIKYRILMIVLGLLLFNQCTIRTAAASDEEKIEEFVKELYQAIVTGDEELLTKYGASEVQIMSSLVLVECGAQEFHNLQVYSYQSSDNTWLVLVGYELENEGIDVWMPGMESLYIMKGEDGSFLLPGQSEAYDPQVLEKHLQLASTDPDIIELEETYQDAFYKIVQNDVDGKVIAYVEKVGQKYDDMIMGRVSEPEGESQEQNTIENRSDSSYVICAGDCLWSIAEEYLGDGLKWSLLYEKNRSIIGTNPNIIFPGQQISLEVYSD